MIETIKLDHNFTFEFFSSGEYSECDIYFNNGCGNRCCQDHVNISLEQAKEMIAALTKFVEAKEKSVN